MSSSSPIHIRVASPDSNSNSRTGLVSSGSGRVSRSYGTVKEGAVLGNAQSRHSITHAVEDGDTLQGIALKYNVSVSLHYTSFHNS